MGAKTRKLTGDGFSLSLASKLCGRVCVVGNDATTIAITICLLGSSITGYVFGVLTNKNNNTAIKSKMRAWLDDPEQYHKARSRYLTRR
jgi:hypothetical protein